MVVPTRVAATAVRADAAAVARQRERTAARPLPPGTPFAVRDGAPGRAAVPGAVADLADVPRGDGTRAGRRGGGPAAPGRIHRPAPAAAEPRWGRRPYAVRPQRPAAVAGPGADVASRGSRRLRGRRRVRGGSHVRADAAPSYRRPVAHAVGAVVEAAGVSPAGFRPGPSRHRPPRPRTGPETAARSTPRQRPAAAHSKAGRTHPLLADPDCAVRGPRAVAPRLSPGPSRRLQHTTAVTCPPGPIGPDHPRRATS